MTCNFRVVRKGGKTMGEMRTTKSPEKVLGILGGLGPAATAEFLRLLAVMAPAGRDQEHPRIMMYSNPQIPDRSSSIMGTGPSPLAALKEGLFQVCEWGADMVAVPCNTAHYFINTFREELPVPLVHIVESTVDMAREQSPEGAWLLATEGTIQSRIYQEYAESMSYKLFSPSSECQREIQESIELVKANQLEAGGIRLQGAVQKLWVEKTVPVVAACTEIPLAYAASQLPRELCISSLGALAKACLDRLYSED